MGKITLTVPDKLEKKIRKEATKRKIPVNRLIIQALTSDSMEMMKDLQFLRQKLFKIQTQNISFEINQDGDRE